jgi:hypothetical protein
MLNFYKALILYFNMEFYLNLKIKFYAIFFNFKFIFSNIHFYNLKFDF